MSSGSPQGKSLLDIDDSQFSDSRLARFFSLLIPLIQFKIVDFYRLIIEFSEKTNLVLAVQTMMRITVRNGKHNQFNRRASDFRSLHSVGCSRWLTLPVLSTPPPPPFSPALRSSFGITFPLCVRWELCALTTPGCLAAL